MTPREVIRAIRADGWQEVAAVGSHRQFRHPTKPGKVTVPMHARDLKPRTLRSVERQSGLRLGP